MVEVLPYHYYPYVHQQTPRALVHPHHLLWTSRDLRTSIKDLPISTPSVLRNGLFDAHRKLSDYYYKMDQSPYYTWAVCKPYPIPLNYY
ncbi:hypothetical protein B0H19DRAFT_15906 [Mycena capillaripes]|nr:hypothetical protein B0H19DRAFT_15906 [Mycena capillaripes]